MRHHKRIPAYLAPGSPPVFPDPTASDGDGLVAVGGDLDPARLVAAYRSGIFPWYEEGIPPLWWSPDPRTVLPLDRLHVSRSMQKLLKRCRVGNRALTESDEPLRFEVSWNQAFGRVIRECSRGRCDGTWIIGDIVEAYERLHRVGHAHSVEVWFGGELVGGLYGVQVGGVFAGESMFHRRPNASKVALFAAAATLHNAGVQLFDVQFSTAHLKTLGAEDWTREQYLDALSVAREVEVDARDPVVSLPT